MDPVLVKRLVKKRVVETLWLREVKKIYLHSQRGVCQNPHLSPPQHPLYTTGDTESKIVCTGMCLLEKVVHVRAMYKGCGLRFLLSDSF